MALTQVEKNKRYRARQRGEYVPPIAREIFYNDPEHEKARLATRERRKRMKNNQPIYVGSVSNSTTVLNRGIWEECKNGEHELDCPDLDCKCQCHADEYKGESTND